MNPSLSSLPPWRNCFRTYRNRRSTQREWFRSRTSHRLTRRCFTRRFSPAHGPFHLTAQPIPFYAPSDVQPSSPSGHSHPHAPPMSSGQQPSTVNLSNLYSKHPLYVDSLQQSLFSGNGINQPQNRSNIEAGESLMHFKPTELPMYSKNPITSFPNLLSNYITGSLGSSTENFSGVSVLLKD